MRVRFLLCVALVAGYLGCQCGPPPGLCEAVRCGPELSCNPADGRCTFTGAGGGLGGGAAGGGSGGDSGTGGGSNSNLCTPACSGATPVCDVATNSCKTCTPALGCSGATPVCETIANGGRGRCVVCNASAGCSGATPWCDPTVYPAGACYECVTNGHCAAPTPVCDPDAHACAVSDGGSGGGGGTVTFDDAGLTVRCLPLDAGLEACRNNECRTGFVCSGGLCVLRGSAGALQVTLRFPVAEDVDLHVVEPLRDGGTCEIWYGNTNNYPDGGIPIPIPIPLPPPCGAKGWLDLDSNAACNIDNVNVENVIYPAGAAPTPGKYTVRVDYYQNCGTTSPVPYEVEVRANGQTRFYCGLFQPNQSDRGAAGSGVTVTEFWIQ